MNIHNFPFFSVAHCDLLYGVRLDLANDVDGQGWTRESVGTLGLDSFDELFDAGPGALRLTAITPGVAAVSLIEGASARCFGPEHPILCGIFGIPESATEEWYEMLGTDPFVEVRLSPRIQALEVEPLSTEVAFGVVKAIASGRPHRFYGV